MIISRTPFRISFFGGGTDYPAWFKDHGGAVLATTIDKYCYLTCRYLPPFFGYNSRILYSRVETVHSNDAIEHPVVREMLRYFGITEGVEIHHDGDLPARTGLGSSSSFTVGMLHTLYALKRIMPSKTQLAKEAIDIEQNILKDNVGCQDQVLAAFGGLVKIDFYQNNFSVAPVIANANRISGLQDHLMLYFTGFQRTASEIAKEQIARTQERTRELTRMRAMVDEAIAVLQGNGNLDDIGFMLDEGWKLKRGLTSKITSPDIDSIYDTACQAGALGGKLLGAGGGGFMLLFARPEDQPNIKKKLEKLLHVPFNFENEGSRIIFYQPDYFEKNNGARSMNSVLSTAARAVPTHHA